MRTYKAIIEEGQRSVETEGPKNSVFLTDMFTTRRKESKPIAVVMVRLMIRIINGLLN